MVAPSGRYSCAIVIANFRMNKAVSQRLDFKPVRFCHLTFNLCISDVLQANPKKIDMHRGV